MWLAYHGKLLTNAQRLCRGMCLSNKCEICGQEPETTLHFLRDCPTARILWDSLGMTNFEVSSICKRERNGFLTTFATKPPMVLKTGQ